MRIEASPRVAIVDYGLGNLFSVAHACAATGSTPVITSSEAEILNSDAVILPGVGAFGDAMQSLRGLDLIGPLRDAATSGKPLMGICLGLQLLMTESFEFGNHRGLNIIEGQVVRFQDPQEGDKILKVPHVGWNGIFRPPGARDGGGLIAGETDAWKNTPLECIHDGELMYFVHSFYVVPERDNVISSVSRYGDHEFCSSLMAESVFGSQFHPERSGPEGLKMYNSFRKLIIRRQNCMDM